MFGGFHPCSETSGVRTQTVRPPILGDKIMVNTCEQSLKFPGFGVKMHGNDGHTGKASSLGTDTHTQLSIPYSVS